ncbi:hypothetical protein MBLNU13_g11262t1 [Cladosporium sp. NU13]
MLNTRPTLTAISRRPHKLPQAATNSSTGSTTHTPADSLPDPWELVHDLGDEITMSLSASRFLATQEPFDRSTAFATLPSSTAPCVVPPKSAPIPIKAALDWLTSTPNSISSDSKSASVASITSTTRTGPHQTTKVPVTTTDAAKAALDWLTSGLDDKSATPTTTIDLKDSSVVSEILSNVEATHTSAAAANRLKLGFW